MEVYHHEHKRFREDIESLVNKRSAVCGSNEKCDFSISCENIIREHDASMDRWVDQAETALTDTVRQQVNHRPARW